MSGGEEVINVPSWLTLVVSILPIVGKIFNFLKDIIFKEEDDSDPGTGDAKMEAAIQKVLDWAEAQFKFDVPDDLEDDVVSLVRFGLQFVFNILRSEGDI